MAVYTYDEEADALYILLVREEDAAIARTVELGPNLHVDIDADERVVGVEILYPRNRDADLAAVCERFGVEIKLPFEFAA